MYKKTDIENRDEGELGRYNRRNREDPVGRPRKDASRARYRAPICYLTAIHHPTTIRADPTPNMDIQNWFSRQKKKVKQLGSKHKLGRTGVDVDGASINPTNPPPGPEPDVVASDGDGNGSDLGVRRAGSMDQPPQPDEPEPAPANRGETDQGAGEAGVDGGKASPMYSHPHPDIKVGAGSGPGREGDGVGGEEDQQIDFHSSTPLIPHSGGPDGVLT